jgi:hydroxyacylglutathione hydrolase
MLIIEPIAAFSDNYIWLLRHPQSTACTVVDPGDGEAVLRYVSARSLTIANILITHHHNDHIGGLPCLMDYGVDTIYGPENPSIEGITHRVTDGDCCTLPNLDQTFKVLTIPGHTLDHIAFYNDAEKIVMCGDTLFAGGCGRVFEGTHPMMHESLQKLAQLPQETKVYCAHEYTQANLAFAKHVEPNNPALLARIDTTQQQRKLDQPTLPSTIATELATNPFLRCEQITVQQQAQQQCGHVINNATDTFQALRQWKDTC